MNKVHKNGRFGLPTTLAAGLALAMAFTLSACGGDGGGGNGDEAPPSSSSGNGSLSSSSSGGGALSSSSQPPPKCGNVEYIPADELCDERGEKKLYKYVEIDGQNWMAENLNFNATGSRCYGDNTGGDSEGNCAEYGRLYGWNTAMGGAASSDANPSGVQGVCPSGWHLPSNAEWQTLIDFAGGDEIAGTKLKSTSGWHIDDYYIPGTDGYGFSALPGGLGDSGGDFNNAGYDGFWWSASEYNSDYAYGMDVSYNIEDAGYNGDSKDVLYSVRCLQD
ncbi:MAG: fibrobacter succinogenes major paralogous domain-containing protein [Fibromonadaceae bacterium]|jgi:uncharacterized protein (TIGR02145 family)|nr:fibrobacter succinogenes major paralogous domain-containing protein [Fibromonadaceae bacterium]